MRRGRRPGPIRTVACAGLALGLVAGACGPGGEGRSDPARNRAADTRQDLLVSAAVSLSESLGEVAAAFERDTGMKVRLNLAASNTLASQILAGAPVDVFVSADVEQFDRLARAGVLDAASRVDVAGNRLVIVQTAGAPVRVGDPRALLEARAGRIALGDPEAVPAGRYARRTLEREGLWEALVRSGRLVPGASVRAALAAVVQGSVQAGIVYATDARTTSQVVVTYAWPADPADPIVYPAAATAASAGRRDARQFLAYLVSAPAQEMMRNGGFEPAPSRASGASP